MGQKQSLSSWTDRYESPAFWLVTWFGSGLFKPAPGTWGSLATLPVLLVFFWALEAFGLEHCWDFVFWGQVAVIVFLFGLGVITIARIERQTGIHDAPEIVIDEVVGQWIACNPYLLSAYFALPTHERIPGILGVFGISFVLFRFFDILKPWPIRWIDRRVKGGFGVMIDDVVAGLMVVAVQAAVLFWMFSTDPYFNPGHG